MPPWPGGECNLIGSCELMAAMAQSDGLPGQGESATTVRRSMRPITFDRMMLNSRQRRYFENSGYFNFLPRAHHPDYFFSRGSGRKSAAITGEYCLSCAEFVPTSSCDRAVVHPVSCPVGWGTP